MKKFVTVFCIPLIVINLLLSAGCSIISKTREDSKKLTVVASLFPQYDFAKQIAKEKADVTLLLPPGTESHTFDPSPADVMKVMNSDVFLYTGDYMEPWAAKLISGIDDKHLLVQDVSHGVDFLKNQHRNEPEHKHDDGNDEHADHDHEYDPHIWLDPTLAKTMVDNIARVFCKTDPANAEFYNKNAEEYKKELDKLDADTADVISRAKRRTVVFAGRFAHLYFINRYGLSYKAAFDGCSAESEPSVKKLVDILDFIKQNDIKCIYYEEYTQPKTATTICEDANIKALRFSTAHNVSKEELDRGITYLEIMRENIKNLEQGLN